MSPPQTRVPISGANGSQPRKLPTFVLSSAPSHKSTSDLCHSDKPQSSGSLQRHASTATGTHALKNGTFQAPRHHDHSYYNRLIQRYHVQSEHTVPHSDVFKPRTLDRVSQKNSSLQGGVNNASGPEGPQEPGKYDHRQIARGEARSSKPCGKDDPEGRTRSCNPGQGAAVAVGSPVGAVNAQPNGCQLPGAPLMRSIPLPNRQERDEYVLSGYGRGLPVPPALAGSWQTGTVKVENVLGAPGLPDVALLVPSFN